MQSSEYLNAIVQDHLLPKGRSSYFSLKMTRGVILDPVEGALLPAYEV